MSVFDSDYDFDATAIYNAGYEDGFQDGKAEALGNPLLPEEEDSPLNDPAFD